MKVIFVDDEPDFLKATTELLTAFGYDIISCSTEQEAAGIIDHEAENVDIALFDMILDRSRDAGLRLTRRLLNLNPNVPVIVLTGHANLENAAESMEAGAFSYVPKERTELLLPTLHRAEEWRRRQMDASSLIPLCLAGKECVKDIESSLHKAENILDRLEVAIRFLSAGNIRIVPGDTPSEEI
jgi:DNA-binding NtrC family response regulator